MTQQFFEGPEKKLELVLAADTPSLRELGDGFWGEVVRAARAEVLSKRSTDQLDAYLLSESSLLVHDRWATLITCGQTSVAEAAAHVVERVTPAAIDLLIVERKNEHFPREQPTSFEEDARVLNALIPGRALRFGREDEHCIHLFHTTRPYAPPEGDTTLEVLMHGIEERSALFHGPTDAVLEAAAAAGVTRILPGFEVDEHAFEPRGYSLNAVLGDEFYTVHVSPERVGSYVSFETNVDFTDDPSAVVRRVVETFRPESFDVLAFVPGADPLTLDIAGYRLRRHVAAPVAGYGVTFHHFYRPPQGPVRPIELRLD